ncbi:MAC/Perforin domain-containing protein [Pisolithus marmoratus]|nr:MAC/Perforin domain-containing protein [Pisolithus marmoratus]
MAARELPAIDWLGYSIDLSRSPTMDLRAASVSVLKGRRIIDFDIYGNLHEVTINGVAYSVPGAVFISQESLFQGAYMSYATGNDAQNAFRADAGLPARYFAVTGTDTAIAVAHDRPFIGENQYAFYSFTNSVYAARLRDYDDLLNEDALLRGVEDLPQQFNGNNENVLAAYKSFFQSFGSHVIVNANYGARFQLSAWALNDNASVNAKFNTDVKAFFNGIPDGGEYDETVKSEAQYTIFLEYLQRLVTVVGGDAQLSSNLTSDPTSWSTYKQWSDNVYTATPTHISFHTIAIWSLMSAFTNNILKSYANEINQAYTWILTRPRVYKTTVIFDIQSDWAEFNLLTPSAVILPDNANPYPVGTIASRSRVQWGKEYSHDYQRQILSPVDFSISHGSNGAGQGQGRAEALIERVRTSSYSYSPQLSFTDAV